MNKTTVKQMQEWYEQHRGYLSTVFARAEIRTFEPDDLIEGKGVVEVERNAVVGTIMFWNKGDIEVLRLNVQSSANQPVVVDDRKQSPAENVSSLIDSYIKGFLAPSNL